VLHERQRSVAPYDYSFFGGLEGWIEHVSAQFHCAAAGRASLHRARPHARMASNAIDYYDKKLAIATGMLATMGRLAAC